MTSASRATHSGYPNLAEHRLPSRSNYNTSTGCGRLRDSTRSGHCLDGHPM